MKPAKFVDGAIKQEYDREEVVDDTSATIGFIKLFQDGRVGVLFSPILFDTGTAMPDEVREQIIEKLRFTADRLEDRSMDARMKELIGGSGGGTA
jgi:hypothetical protein